MRTFLRIGLGLTFVIIGVLILKNPLFWLGFVKPWALAILPRPLLSIKLTGFLDLTIGILFLADIWTWAVALLASIHLIIILIICGVDDVTVRDIGLLGGTLALFWDGAPKKLKP